jgi:hypothetical protein
MLSRKKKSKVKLTKSYEGGIILKKVAREYPRKTGINILIK